MAALGMHFWSIKKCCGHSSHCVCYKRNLPVCDVSKKSGNSGPYHWVLVRDRLAGHDGDHPAGWDVLHHAVQGDVAVLPQEPDDGDGEDGDKDGRVEGEDQKEQGPVRLSSLENQRQSDLLQVGLHAALQLAKQVLDGNHERYGKDSLEFAKNLNNTEKEKGKGNL